VPNAHACIACILSTNQRLHDYLSLKIVRRHETFRPERHEERPHRRLGAGAGIVGAAGAHVRRAEQRQGRSCGCAEGAVAPGPQDQRAP
jgi:hypothetical protein